MRRWTTAIFPWVAVVALLMIVTRYMLPILGLGGAGGENIRLLVKLMPVSITLLVSSIAIIVFNLRRQSKFIDLRSKALVDEVRDWNDELQYGDLTPEKALGWQSLSEVVPAESIASSETVESGAAAFSPQESSFVKFEPALDADLPDSYDSSLLPEIEKKIEDVFRGSKSNSYSPEGTDGADDEISPFVQAEFIESTVPGPLMENGAHESRATELNGHRAHSAETLVPPPLPLAESTPQRMKADSFSEATRMEETPVEFEQDLAAEEEASEKGDANRRLSEDVIARYQKLIESANQPSSTLFQLPPLPAEFSGRSLELEDLLAAHATREVRVLGLQGLGGVGKTTLALKLADRLKGEYPDAQFYIDLKGASSQPLSAAAAQALVVRACLPTVRLPESEAELAQLYRSLLIDKRAILLLDNAVNDQQLAPLIAPSGCLTIITSRQHISLPNSFLRHLEGLPESEACDLLLKLMPQIGAQAPRIAELCGYLPLALKLAAGVLLINPGLEIDDYVKNLEMLQQAARNSGRSTRPIDAVLKLSYQQLVPGLQKLWRLLSVFNDTFDVNAAASIWKLQLSRATNALDRLFASCMVERNRATGRFRLHDLMAAFADAHMTEDEQIIARQRHADHYQSVLHEADALYEQGGDLMKLGLDLVDLEWLNILAGQQWAAVNVDRDRVARDLCNSYPDAGKFVLDLRQHPRDRIRWCEAALAAARKMKRFKAAARHLIALGDAYTALSEIPNAMEFYEQALGITRKARDRRGEADALSGLGTSHYLSGGFARARELHKEAMTLYDAVSDQRGEASALGSLGFVHYAMGELKQAAILFEKQLGIARQIGDRRSESTALGGLGITSYATGDSRKAVQILNQQLAITREIGDRRGEAGALTNLGSACATQKYLGQAIAFQEQALTIAREIGDRRCEASALGGLGVTEFIAGNYDRSIELLNSQLNLTREIGDLRGEALCLSQLGEVLVRSGKTYRAIDALKQAFNINSQIGDLTGQANSLFDLALVLDSAGERRQAIEQAETALRLYEIAEHPKLQAVQKKLNDWRR